MYSKDENSYVVFVDLKSYVEGIVAHSSRHKRTKIIRTKSVFHFIKHGKLMDFPSWSQCFPTCFCVEKVNGG